MTETQRLQSVNVQNVLIETFGSNNMLASFNTDTIVFNRKIWNIKTTKKKISRTFSLIDENSSIFFPINNR